MGSQEERLLELARQVARKKKLQAMSADLARQADDLSRRVEELDRVRLKEQADVDALERTSLSRLFYQFAGKLDEKLDQETAEALRAAVQYESASAQLRALREEIDRCQRELAGLYHCEADYQRALEARAQTLKARGGADAGAVCLLEEEIARLESQANEIWEAVQAGNNALDSVSSIQNALSSAEGWGTWDLVGGGLFSDFLKHSRLDEAQDQLTRLQVDLRRFRTELVDVNVDAGFQIRIDGFLRFADYFFDGLFADWAVLSRIHDAQRQVDDVGAQIQQILEQLRQQEVRNQRQAADCRRQLEELLLSSAGG